MLNIEFDATAAGQLLEMAIQDVVDTVAAGDFTEAFSDIAHGPLSQQIRREFDLEVGPDGNPWEPWHFRTPWAPEDHPTLRVSGDLYWSYLAGADHVESFGPQEMEFGSALPYAGIHQDGATFTTGIPMVSRTGGWIAAGTQITIPARPVVGWADETVEAAEQIIGVAMVEMLAKKKGAI